MWRIETLVTLHGSSEVRRLLEKWTECARKLREADIVIGMAERTRDYESSIHEDAKREHLAVEDYRRAIHDADEAIREQMNTELASQVASPRKSIELGTSTEPPI
jgi:hypothetical protein